MREGSSNSSNINTVDRISLVLVVHNEAGSIERVIREFYKEIGEKIPLEIIVAEDGSTDGTREMLYRLSKEIPMHLITGEKRKGYIGGIKTGLAAASSEYVFFSEADGQYVPYDFWKFYELRKEFDLIIGKKVKRCDPVLRIVMSKLFHLFVRVIFRLPVDDPDTGFRLMKRKVVRDLIESVRFLKYSAGTEFTIRAWMKGYKIHQVLCRHRFRTYQKSRYIPPLKRMPLVFLTQFLGLRRLISEIKKKNSPAPRII